MKNLQKNIRITPRDSHSIESYFHDIAKLPRLSTEDEVILAQRIHAGDEKALEQMVLGNLRFVVTVAKNYMNMGLELPDLISAGNIGLITAARRFDETRGNKFCTYAVWWIRQAITQALAKDGRVISLPANQLALLSKIGKETMRLEQELQRTPDNTEVTDRLNENNHRINQLLCSSQKPVSLDAPIQDNDDLVRIDTLTDSAAPDTDNGLIRESLHNDIVSILSLLSKTESSVIKMHFGIDHPRSYSIDEIAIHLKLSRERVRQIHNKAILRLQRSNTKERLRSYL